MIGKLTQEQVIEVLKRNALGHIACHDGKKPYVVPINYIYNEGYIIAHSILGMKIQMMRENPSVCFQVEEIESFMDWRSVVIWGEYQELNEEKEQYDALKLFVSRIMHLKISETAVPPELTENRVHPRSPGAIKPVVWRIKIEEMTGRYEKAGS